MKKQIYDLLKEDHEKVKKLLEKMERTSLRSGKKRQELVEKLKTELVPHARAEERVLYEALKEGAQEAEFGAYEGYEEHYLAEQILDELSHTDPTSKRWAAKLAVLKESLEHHIKEEEKKDFKLAKKMFSRQEAKEMGEQFQQLKKQVNEDLPHFVLPVHVEASKSAPVPQMSPRA